jgi:uncharacterized protein with PQ loop repeat
MYMHAHKVRNKIFPVDKLLSPLAFIAPLFTLPQLYEVWFLKRTEGVSALSWFLMSVMALLWFWHALLHKDTQLAINTGLMIFFNFSIFLGVILHSNLALY